jgi:hypothetical protein
MKQYLARCAAILHIIYLVITSEVPYSPNKNPQNSQEEHENKKKIM